MFRTVLALALTLVAAPAFAEEGEGGAAVPVPPPPGVPVPVEGMSFQEYYGFAQQVDPAAHSVSLERFLELREQPGTVVLDLRPPEIYAASHVEGAINVGADITAEKLAELVPDKGSTVLLYCSYSLMPVRMIALTHVALPQFLLLGYDRTFMLEPIWFGNIEHWDTAADRLPMTGAQ
jgi:hypothetical protein